MANTVSFPWGIRKCKKHSKMPCEGQLCFRWSGQHSHYSVRLNWNLFYHVGQGQSIGVGGHHTAHTTIGLTTGVILFTRVSAGPRVLLGLLAITPP
jgi:hypothetical protein